MPTDPPSRTSNAAPSSPRMRKLYVLVLVAHVVVLLLLWALTATFNRPVGG